MAYRELTLLELESAGFDDHGECEDPWIDLGGEG
jgi:hypothetical protein